MQRGSRVKRSRHSQLGLVELRQPPLHLKLALSPHYLPLGAGTSSASSQTQTQHTVQQVPAAVRLVQCRYFQPQQHPTDLDTTQTTLDEARPPSLDINATGICIGGSLSSDTRSGGQTPDDPPVRCLNPPRLDWPSAQLVSNIRAHVDVANELVVRRQSACQDQVSSRIKIRGLDERTGPLAR